jgi:AAA domain
VENGKSKVFDARTRKVNGKSATLSVAGAFRGTSIRSITTVGRECLTNAEDKRESIMLKALQGRILLDQNPFVHSIWLSTRKLSWSGCPVTPVSPTLYFPSNRRLNVSQQKAVNAILSNADDHRVVLIQGPPGTGKTTVIAASVMSTMASSETNTLWLVAQSNVAVKNIAEKLATEGFLGFKILVSKDFHFDWYCLLFSRGY